MESFPGVNGLVVLRDSAGREYRSRVEDLAPGVVIVAQPFDLPAEHDYRPGTELLVTWTCERGTAVLPSQLLGTHVEGRLRLWSMGITGDGWVEQRRRFVRVPASGRVTLKPRSDEPPVKAVRGYLLDVSEAALRCAVDVATADTILTDGVEVSASFRFGDDEFAIPARIGFRRPNAHPGDESELAELVVLFDEPVRSADALRKQIFAEQLRTRRG